MYSFIENIIERGRNGIIRDTYIKYLAQWKVNDDKYALQHYFQTLIEYDLPNEACQLLFDEDYLIQKKSAFDWRQLESEFEYAAIFYLENGNTYKYLYSILLSRLP